MPPSTLNPAELSASILERCRVMGFAAAGIAPVQPSRWSAEVLAWLAQGRHGTMDYLAKDLELKFDPAQVLPGTRAFIMVADQYAPRERTPAPATDGFARGRIARYAQGRNYHWVIKDRLHGLSDQLRAEHPGAQFRTFVDTVPVLERELAELAGLGWHAKNTMIINPRLGSYLLLGGVATTLDLAPPADQPAPTDHCGTCTRCIDACPTSAITPYSVDGSRCISYLTIERRETIPPDLHAPMGDWLYGCDICQDVCPHNSVRTQSQEGANPAYTSMTPTLSLLDVLGWTSESRRAAFTSSAMKRASLPMMKRNALIAAGNVLLARPDAALLARITDLANDVEESDLVRETAHQVVAALRRMKDHDS